MYSDDVVQNIVYVVFVLLKGFNVVHLFYNSDLTIVLKIFQYVTLLSNVKIKIYEKNCSCIRQRE